MCPFTSPSHYTAAGAPGCPWQQAVASGRARNSPPPSPPGRNLGRGGECRLPGPQLSQHDTQAPCAAPTGGGLLFPTNGQKALGLDVDAHVQAQSCLCLLSLGCACSQTAEAPLHSHGPGGGLPLLSVRQDLTAQWHQVTVSKRVCSTQEPSQGHLPADPSGTRDFTRDKTDSLLHPTSLWQDTEVLSFSGVHPPSASEVKWGSNSVTTP